jgi:hypothetical protein
MFDTPEEYGIDAPWEKITKKMVDPITFSCRVNIAFMPRIEDSLHETTCSAHAHPRIPGDDSKHDKHTTSTHNHKHKHTTHNHKHSHQKRSSSVTSISSGTSATSATSAPTPLQRPSARDRNHKFSPSTPNNNINNARRSYNPAGNTTKEEKLEAMNKFAGSTWATPFGDDDDEKKQEINSLPEKYVKKLNPPNMFGRSSSKGLDDDSLSNRKDNAPPHRVKDATFNSNSNPVPRSSSPPPPKNEDCRNNKHNSNSNNNKDIKTGNSLGAFLKMVSHKTVIAAAETDNQSISSKSLTSRSVADRSHAERSKSEQKLFDKKSPLLLLEGDEPENASPTRRRQVRRRESLQNSVAMKSIDERSLAKDSAASEEKKKQNRRTTPSSAGSNSGGPAGGPTGPGMLSNFLDQAPPPAEEKNGGHDADSSSVMSGSTLGSRSISQRSTADRSKKEQKLAEMVKSPYRAKQKLVIKEDSREDLEDEDDDINSLTMEELEESVIEKKLRFKDGHEVFEISYPTNSMYDDLYWAEDELADFRHVAFLEEAGLDIDEYM